MKKLNEINLKNLNPKIQFLLENVFNPYEIPDSCNMLPYFTDPLLFGKLDVNTSDPGFTTKDTAAINLNSDNETGAILPSNLFEEKIIALDLTPDTLKGNKLYHMDIESESNTRDGDRLLAASLLRLIQSHFIRKIHKIINQYGVDKFYSNYVKYGYSDGTDCYIKVKVNDEEHVLKLFNLSLTKNEEKSIIHNSSRLPARLHKKSNIYMNIALKSENIKLLKIVTSLPLEKILLKNLRHSGLICKERKELKETKLTNKQQMKFINLLKENKKL